MVRSMHRKDANGRHYCAHCCFAFPVFCPLDGRIDEIAVKMQEGAGIGSGKIKRGTPNAPLGYGVAQKDAPIISCTLALQRVVRSRRAPSKENARLANKSKLVLSCQPKQPIQILACNQRLVELAYGLAYARARNSRSDLREESAEHSAHKFVAFAWRSFRPWITLRSEICIRVHNLTNRSFEIEPSVQKGQLSADITLEPHVVVIEKGKVGARCRPKRSVASRACPAASYFEMRGAKLLGDATCFRVGSVVAKENFKLEIWPLQSSNAGQGLQQRRRAIAGWDNHRYATRRRSHCVNPF